MMMKLAAFVMMSAGLVACGGDICSAEVGSLAGTWEFTIGSGTNTDGATLVIDEDGSLTLTTDSGDGWQCDLVNDALCALKVHCTQGNDDFTLTLTKK